MSESLQVPIATISTTLRHLRELDLVRYETKWKQKEYWVKDKGILQVLERLERWVDDMRERSS